MNETSGTCTPELDPGFVPAARWTRDYAARVEKHPGRRPLVIGLERPDGTRFVHRTRVLPDGDGNDALTIRFVERLVKFLLWQQGGSHVIIGGPAFVGRAIADAYRPGGARAFDTDLMGLKVFGEPMRVSTTDAENVPGAVSKNLPLGRHLDGCRIGFDLGGSDRKAAAVIDGNVVFSEEIRWDPYFQSDPAYHYEGIRDSLTRAAAHLPRVDAIGGSAAGIYVNNEVRVASLFRGVSERDFETHVRGLFHRLKAEWNGIPFDVVNDGEVTALAASMSLQDNAVLGVSMGTSQAAGYCDDAGHITPWLNELAFAPVDFRDNAPVDEWSGDRGCGVQYFSQQAVARLAPEAGIALPADMPFAERLIEVQTLMKQGDPRAASIYRTVGAYLGHAIVTYASFYAMRHLLILGRVTSGDGGGIIMETARAVLAREAPEVAEAVTITTPDEQFKRHGQAVAAASLPARKKEDA